MRHVLLALPLLLAACSKPAGQPAANTATPAQDEGAAPAAAVPALEGEWAVEQLSGKAPDQIWPMTATVANGRFTIHSECRQLAWNYTQDRNIVRFTPTAGRECGRVRSPAEYVANNAVKLANIAMFSDDGRSVELSGAGGSLSMTRR